jgi:hypothetical protein
MPSGQQDILSSVLSLALLPQIVALRAVDAEGRLHLVEGNAIWRGTTYRRGAGGQHALPAQTGTARTTGLMEADQCS